MEEEESPNFHVQDDADHGLLRRPLRSISVNGLCYNDWSSNQDCSNRSSSSSYHGGGLSPRGYDRDREDEEADKLISEFSFPKFADSLTSTTSGITELHLGPSHTECRDHGDDDPMGVLGEKIMLRTLFVEKPEHHYDHEDSRDYSAIFRRVYPGMDFSKDRRSAGVLLDCYEESTPSAFDFLGDKNSLRLNDEVGEVVSYDSTFGLLRGIHPSPGHHSPLGITAPPFAGKNSSSDSKRPNYGREVKVDRDVAAKKIKVEAIPPLKVRKEKLGDKITALQQLVSPFGKTDTASVLMEAIGYIKFLQNQVQTLCVPYMKASRDENAGAPSCGLQPRGLCLVPLTCTSLVTSDGAGGGGGFWPPVPYYGSC